MRINLKSERINRSPENKLSHPLSFRPPKPHKNELNVKPYDVAGPGFSVHDLTDNVEIKTAADTFYDHGERERIKCSKIGLNQWQPGVKIRDMYTYGFKGHFGKTNPKFGMEFYDMSEQPTVFDKIPCSLPKSTANRDKEHYFTKAANNKKWVPGYKYNNIDDWSKVKIPAFGEYNKRTFPR